MSTTERLAGFALEFSLAEAPVRVRDAARLRILDTIAVTLAGSREDCSRIANRTDIDLGNTGTTTLVGMQRQTSCLQAAFINGVSAHALEYDDITSSVVTHTSAVVVPSVLALAEKIEASGADLLAAYIVGFEVATRIGWGLQNNLLPRGWHPNGVLAVIGCAAAGSRLLGSTRDQTRVAIGIAASCSAGLRKNVGSMTKPFHMGHAAMSGILAAQLARNGYTANPGVFEQSDASASSARGHGHFSYPEVFAGPGGYDLSKMEAGLGTRFELDSDSTITRFHPGSTFPQAAIDETIALVTANHIAAEAIASIRVGVTPMCLAIAPYAVATNGLDARFCLAYPIAAAAIDREVGIRQYDDARVQCDDVQTLMQAVEVYVPAEFAGVTHAWTAEPPTPVSCRIEIRTRDGRSYRGARDTTRGYPGTVVGWNDIHAKFNECATLVLPQSRVDTAAAMIRDIADLKNVKDLTAILAA